MNANPPTAQPSNLKYWIIIGGIAVPVAIAIAGFLPAGVAAGSIAAGIHSNIGVVASGSTFAIFQSLGTMPLVGAEIGMVALGGLGFFAHQYAVPWFSRIFSAMKDAFWTAVEVTESLWLKLQEMLKDAFWTVVEVSEKFGSQGKSKTQ